MDEIMNFIEKLWEISLVRASVYLLFAFLAAFIAGFITKKLIRFTKLDRRIGRRSNKTNTGDTAVKFLSKLAFLIVFLLFLPPALEALGIESVTDSITGFVTSFADYLPRIIAALVIGFIGVFLGELLEDVASALLRKTRLDDLGEKYRKEGSLNLSDTIGKIIRAVIVLIAIVEALRVLGLEAISAPAASIVSTFFSAIPHLFLSGIVIAVGIIISNIVSSILEGIFSSIDLDGRIAKLFKTEKETFSPMKLIVAIVRTLIILFVLTEGVRILGLTVLSSIMEAVIAYLPMVIKAIIIAFVAYFGANALASVISRISGMKTSVGFIKAAIYVISGFMILSELGFATVIVNYAFIITLAAIALAFALSFGIGGRDFAKNTLSNIGDEKLKKDTSKKEESDSKNNSK